MNSLFQLISKRLPVFTVLLGLFIFFYPIVEVNASGIGPTFTGDKKTITPESPNELNFLSIKSAEENKATGTNCGVSTISGLFASVFNSVEKISSVRFKDFAEAKYCGDSDSVKKFVTGQVNSSGILGLLNKVNGSVMEQRPASGIQYAEEKVYAITNPGVVYAAEPSSYFPGTGFDLLQPVRSFWGWSVNLVFGFLIIIILLVAFAIIFRQKLSGSAEVTIQNAIPNIALAMILVPLSYAISGLFIDGITIGSNAVHDFLVGPASPGNQVFTSRESTDIQNGSERDRGLYIDDERVNWINARSQADYRQEIEQISEGVGVNAGPLSVISTLLNILDEDEINKGSDNPGATSAWLGTIINAILSIFMIWIGIKVFIALFKKYITILLMPIFSPFIFATVAVPGNGTKAIVNYAKLMGSASLGFIVAYAMFLLTIIFSNSAFQSTIPDFNTGLWVPPLLGLQSNGVLGIDQTGLSGAGAGIGIVPFLLGLVSLGIYFSIPSVLNQIDAALGAKFAIPDFIKAPIDSFKESYKVTKGFGFRSIARGTNISRNAFGATRNTVNDIRSGKFSDNMNRRFNFSRNARLKREKDLNLGGIDGSETSKINDELNERYAAASNKYNQARRDYAEALKTNDRAAIRRAEDNAAQAKQSIEDIKEIASNYPQVRLSAETKSEDKFEMKVEFQSYVGGQNNAILFSRDTILSLFNKDEIEKAGKLIFTLQGDDYRFAKGDIIEVGPVARRELVNNKSPKDPNDEVFDTRQSYIEDVGGVATQVINDIIEIPGPLQNVDLFKRSVKQKNPIVYFSFNNSLQIYPDKNFNINEAVINNGKQYVIPLSLKVINPTKLFGTMEGDIKTLSVTWINGELPAAPNVRPTDKVAFRIKNRDIVTDAFNIRVGKTQ